MGTEVDRINFMHYSTAECFEKCPYQWWLRYHEALQTLDDFNATNALKIGTALHRAMETDTETALHEYMMSFPVITDDVITECMKLETVIPKVKEAVPEGLHEVEMHNYWYQGTMDLLVPCTKLDAELPEGQFDLYDYKYSNNVDSYMESKQLHVYKWMCEHILHKKIRKMYFVFVPKCNFTRNKNETLQDFRTRCVNHLEQQEVQIKEVQYDLDKVLQFFNTVETIRHTTDYPKKKNLCRWCDYSEYCLKGDKNNMLPSTDRRQIGKTVKRKLWIYGAAFSGKTTFCDQCPNPLNLNTDGNVKFVTMPFVAIKDTYEGRQKILAWKVFKDTVAELEKGGNDFHTIIVDLLEDTYESCRLYMYDKLGITHESDDAFRAWDKVRTEYLSTIRRLVNLDYENIILISHEDTSKDITKKSGDKITAIKPNINDKVANKVAGMVDIVARVVVEDDETRTLNFKANEVVFGGGRLKGIKETQIPLEWDALCKVYDEANGTTPSVTAQKAVQKHEEPQTENEPSEAEKPQETTENKPTRRTRKPHEETPAEVKEETPVEVVETPVRKRRTRRQRTETLDINEDDLPF